MDESKDINYRKLLGTTPYSPETMKRLASFYQAYFNPKYIGLENIISDKPALLVGNHCIYGFFETPIILDIFIKKGILIHGLSDSLHNKIPLWRDFLAKTGIVEESRENAVRLINAGRHILVLPGGAREVFKRKGENYKLMWKRRTGFVSLAVEFGYEIIPFASVGGDDAYSIVVDANNILETSIGKFIKNSSITKKILRGGEIIPPLAFGLGPTLLPRPVRLYYSFGESIKTNRYAGKHKDKKAMLELRGQIEDSVMSQIGELLHIREQDTEGGILRRFLNRFK
jgi:1-acyl-sn-glycerol-3-phosphate acyltransferase